MNLKEAIEHAHCRKGAADGTTKAGAYWLALAPICIRSWGGDGIGQSAPSHDQYLELRHYRDGAVRAKLHHTAWHENGEWSGGGVSTYIDAGAILGATTVEQVIVLLKVMRCHDEYQSGHAVYSDRFEAKLTEALVSLGLADALPAPDEGGI